MERALATSRDPSSPADRKRRIRLMIVDDSIVARAVLSRMIESDDGFEIVATAANAEDAIAALRSVHVDTIILDLEMPGLGGLKSIPKILEAANGARIMIVSTLADEGAEQTVAALALGATDALPKPGTGKFAGRFSEILVGRLKALGFADENAAPIAAHSDQKPPIQFQLRAMPTDMLQILAIGASTGGIHALTALFEALPKRIGAPILVTQHLPALFMPVFARQLTAAAQREALVAEDGMRLAPDRIILAPGDAHITVQADVNGPMVRLLKTPAPSGCMPSVDPMLESIGKLYGAAAVGVVLTGMGRDGVRGAARLVADGGSVLAQDEGSCAVFGMPRAVLEAGLCSAALPPDKLARRVASRIGERRCK
jgi:two-component system chemotaxis response regulator CheB